MPWQETDPMTERLQFITTYLSQVYSMSELCERFGIRRHTGYTWVRRYTEQGLAGLQEKSRAPHRCPHRLAEEMDAPLLEAKRAHPNWGPRQILPDLARRRPHRTFPAASTAGAAHAVVATATQGRHPCPPRRRMRSGRPTSRASAAPAMGCTATP